MEASDAECEICHRIPGTNMGLCSRCYTEFKAIMGAFLDLTKQDPQRGVQVDEWLSAANQRLERQALQQDGRYHIAN